jgi:outer membrane protein assembly factor BamD
MGDETEMTVPTPGRARAEPARMDNRGMHAFTRRVARAASWCVMIPTLLLSGACASSQPFVGMEPEEVYVTGLQAYLAEDWDTAIDAFERLLVASPNFPQAADARLNLARAHFQREEYISAAAEFERFLQRHPGHDQVAQASIGMCRSYARLSPIPPRDQEYTRLARDQCRQTRNDFPGLNIAEEADSIRAEMVERLAEKVFLEASFYQRRGFHDSAIIVFQDLVDFYPETSWAPRGFLAMYRSYRAIGWEEEAEETRNRLLFLYPDSPAARELRADSDGG